MSERLTALEAGQIIVHGGNRTTTVPGELAASFRDGDQLIVVQDTGDLLHVPAAEHAVAGQAVSAAVEAFHALGRRTDRHISDFFESFAAHLADDETFAPIADANRADMARASAAGRSTTRLELSDRMRDDMIAGLRMWRDAPAERDGVIRRLDHEGWSLEARTSPVGVVGFVFEGRPNVFADAAGVVRTGNTVVFRIGSDALGTAEAIVEHALDPALRAAGLPPGTVRLVPSASRAAGWALFGDRRLALAVARGSGPAVAQLGAVARQSGIAVSLHGTGGAWLIAASSADAERFRASVTASLDRKVCNTLNVCAVTRDRAPELVPAFLQAAEAAAVPRGTLPRVHVDTAARSFVPDEWLAKKGTVSRAGGDEVEQLVTEIDRSALGNEWEWETAPEVSLVVTDDVDEAIDLCNTHSPRFVASIVTGDEREAERFYRLVDAPFVGDGFTRWVDGQYALSTPELGLSNWQHGRLLGRGGVLSGDSVHTVRYRATITDPQLSR